MFWLILSVLSAMFDSIRDAASKKSLKNVEPELAALSNAIFAAPVMLAALIIFEKPVFDSTFWSVVAIHSIILALAFLLYMKSLKTTDVSLAIPFTALSPAFMLILAPLLLGENTTNAGSAGVLLIALGAYLVNAKKASGGILEPFRAAWRERGVMLMVLVAFLWSITATVDKIALRHASLLFYLTIDYIFISILLYANLLMSRKKQALQQIKSNFWTLAGIGVFFALSGIAYVYSIKMTFVAYALAVKRTSILFSVILGALLFKEKNIRERLLGAALMVAGVAIISLL